MKAIIFDCYGVLVGTGFWNVYQSLGGDLTKDEAFITEQLDKVDLGTIDSQKFSQTMADRLGISVEAYKTAFQKDELPDEQMFEFIRTELKPKYKLGLMSNATGDSVRRKISSYKLALFDEVIISGEVGLLKPDPQIFKLALDRLGVPPAEALFIDDHQEYIVGAQEVGLHTLLYTNFKDFKNKLTDIIRK